MKFHWNKRYLQIGITAFCVIAASMLFYFGIFHMDTIKAGLNTIYTILTPIIYAAVISYILWPIIRFVENNVIYRICKMRNWNPSSKIRKIIRMLGVLISLLVFFLLIYGLLSMLIPEIVNSITNIVDSFPRYINNIQAWLSGLLKNYPELEASSTTIFSSIFSRAETWLSNDLLPQVNNLVKNFSTSFFSILIFLKNFLIGAMISIYLLYGKENYVAHGKQVLYCIFSTETTNNIIRDLQFVDKTFGGFIVGKILDSVIIGILCYIGTTILNLPYALLVSVIVGVTNVIPFFGPYIGAIPSAFLILLVNPIQCVYFVIFILILQQFDGNFLGPKILGGSTGLSSFMVIVAILLGGGLFGIVGMFIGVPAFAVICTIVRNRIDRRLEKKHLPVDIKCYENIDHLDSETLEPVYRKDETTDSKEAFSSYIRKKIVKTDQQHLGILQRIFGESEPEELISGDEQGNIEENENKEDKKEDKSVKNEMESSQLKSENKSEKEESGKE